MVSEINAGKFQYFQSQMIAYWDEHGRKNLPWRKTRDPWLLLLTEIMLRKTTSEQVNDLFDTFSQWSPSDVLKMEIEELEEHLKPLGLSRVRAVQLKKIAAGFLQADNHLFQSDEYLRSFPGIGRYISNSVRCCAFDDPVPALDTNMIRIIQRVFGWETTRKRLREDRVLWSFAETLVPKERASAYNWGILDFGAAVCTAKNPKCPLCPISSICLYYLHAAKQKATPPPIEETNRE